MNENQEFQVNATIIGNSLKALRTAVPKVIEEKCKGVGSFYMVLIDMGMAVELHIRKGPIVDLEKSENIVPPTYKYKYTYVHITPETDLDLVLQKAVHSFNGPQ